MRPAIEKQFSSFDGCRIFYRAWLPIAKPKGAVVLLHRGHEYSGRFSEFVQRLDLDDYAIFAWDARGHGESDGERGFARHFSDLARDLDFFCRELCAEYELVPEQMAFVGHSVAAVVLAQWVHDYAPRIRAVVLATPAFDVKLYVPFALPALRLDRAVSRYFGKGPRFIKSYVKGKLLTHDANEAKSYDADSRVSKQIAANVLVDLFDVSKRLIADAPAIETPTLLLSARADWVVKNKPQRIFFNRLSSKWKEVEVYKDFYHAIFHEEQRELVFARVRRFLLAAFERPPEAPDHLHADERGYTKEEFQWLSAGLPLLSFKRLGYRAQQYSMKTLGKMSDGIDLAWKYGFDSGQSLDYVYKNIASGKNALGRLMDRTYLDSVGWKGIRKRKVHIEELIEAVLLRSESKPDTSPTSVKVFDLAGGPGRYLLETVKRHPDKRIEVVIRDSSEAALEQGRRIAEQLGLRNIVHQAADAFEDKSLAELPCESDLGIVSGLYELFSENEPVLRSLRGVYAALKRNGFLIYTNQPWHPQLEMIAEVLMNREGKPWVMRRRTQLEIDQLVAIAGFRKLRTLADEEGIFTVSLAQRD